MSARRRSALGGAIIAAVVMLAGCAQSSAPSRATLYESIDDLAADSSAIVIGRVADQSREGDTTISSVEVVNAPDNPHLTVDAGTEAITVGDVAEVRQISEPYLRVGDEYVLFLTPSGLPGDAADQYFITGAVAGLYAVDGTVARRVVTDSGDTLPETIEIAGR